MQSKLRKKLVASLLSVLVTLVMLDVALHLSIVRSDRSYGRLFGVELPPHRIVPWGRIPSEPERLRWFDKLRWTKTGVPVTNGDLRGILREDPILGHAPRENTVSKNRWWHANNYGARASRDIGPVKPANKYRVFIFGDSYAQGSRVSDEEVWSAFLATRDQRLELWNFGVDGYNMAQSYLRFQLITAELDYDLALLVFVPGKSLWRDINTIRYIGQAWDSYKINPRFVLEDDRLRLIQSPYEDLGEMVIRNKSGITDELREHLKEYDAFYIESKFEAAPIRDRSIILKRISAMLISRRENRIMAEVMEPGSEAQRVSKKIFEAMNQEANQRGKEFCLVVLPDKDVVEQYQEEPAYAWKWNAMSAFMCSGDYSCIDLMQDFSRLTKIDKGYDGSHFGPKTNQRIADFLWERIFNNQENRGASVLQ
jgi:hypothetical protein